MSRPQKILTIVLWIVAVAGLIGVVAMKILPANSASPSAQSASAIMQVRAESVDVPLSTSYPAPSFTLIDQDGDPATNLQFLGHPWIADFIFTTCASLCPTMSAHMSDLQAQLPADVKLASFSVDPTHDTPAALKEYAAKYHAQPNRWIFLTGDQKNMERVIDEMKLGFTPGTADTPIQHDEHFVLIDAEGKIRGFYDSLIPEKMDALVHDARTLSAHPTGAGQ